MVMDFVRGFQRKPKLCVLVIVIRLGVIVTGQISIVAFPSAKGSCQSSQRFNPCPIFAACLCIRDHAAWVSGPCLTVGLGNPTWWCSLIDGSYLRALQPTTRPWLLETTRHPAQARNKRNSPLLVAIGNGYSSGRHIVCTEECILYPLITIRPVPPLLSPTSSPKP